MARYWVRYACGTVGLSVCSMWLLRHSSLVGSPDIDNWICEAKEFTISFWNDHVDNRDELFDTFRKRHKGVIDVEEVQLTADSLHRYEKELMHPIQNLLGGELARALLIQVSAHFFGLAMLELDQILKANEINFAILAALPAFFLSLPLLMLVRSWIKQDRGAEGRGKIASIQRRLLIVEVEKKIMQHQLCVDQGQEQDAQCMFGLMLYCLDRLYHAVERHAQATGEWLCLRQDIIELGKPGLPAAYKLTITSRMFRVYDCLLPFPKR
ncbi:DGS1, mitochondrial-like protein [Drosera capensis]